MGPSHSHSVPYTSVIDACLFGLIRAFPTHPRPKITIELYLVVPEKTVFHARTRVNGAIQNNQETREMANVDLDTILDCLKRMEQTALGLRQIRRLLPKTLARDVLDDLIVDAEQFIAEIKRKVIQ